MEIMHIEDKNLPEEVVDIYYSYPNSKVLDKNNNYVFGYSLVKYGDTIYLVHDLGNSADLYMFLKCANSEHFDYEAQINLIV
jgi:hypothetical protein